MQRPLSVPGEWIFLYWLIYFIIPGYMKWYTFQSSKYLYIISSTEEVIDFSYQNIMNVIPLYKLISRKWIVDKLTRRYTVSAWVLSFKCLRENLLIIYVFIFLFWFLLKVCYISFYFDDTRFYYPMFYLMKGKSDKNHLFW